jgi:WD40 repeat protein
VILWDVAAREQVRSISAHGLYVNAVAFSPDGQSLLTGSLDRTVRRWAVATGAPIRKHGPFPSPVAAVAVPRSGYPIAAACFDGNVHLLAEGD